MSSNGTPTPVASVGGGLLMGDRPMRSSFDVMDGDEIDFDSAGVARYVADEDRGIVIALTLGGRFWVEVQGQWSELGNLVAHYDGEPLTPESLRRMATLLREAPL